MVDIIAHNRLVQFLKGLNDCFDDVRSQILVMDHLLIVNKAYSMVLRIEKQRYIQTSFYDNLNNNVLLVKTIQNGGGKRQGNKKKYGSKKEDRMCDHCGGNGHTKDTCFKLHGYPDWFKQLRKEKGSSSRTQANMVNSPLDEDVFTTRRENSTKLSPALLPCSARS